ncbi:MAG: DUF2804 domain-containing protein [Parvibaculum sp.]|uniref:DUF2804 domain-containing protein n=1 Tax=Parvibaculum sp. TaxID=2024848 RepID=UPI00284D2C18|nr:DUF2804 domain-containing protein [Parvibaculum sp.]MDR3498848.1 DUF2804 domain-containing protein [Parvibaculum sp.]
MQRELTAGNLLDDKGRLAEAGWARSELRRYRRADIGAPWYRIKEWDYYCILSGDYGIALTVADNGYMGLLSASWLDFAAPDTFTESVILPFTRGRMRLPESADAGDIVQTHPKISLAFRHENGGRRLTVDCPDFARGRGLSGEIRLDQPEMDRMVIATPFPKAPRAFYYNQKINCLPATGEIEFDGKRHVFAPSTAAGVLDWGRGVWTYDNTWYWGSASGLVGGRPFGFNIGYGFGDTSAASENMVFLDGRAHKLGEVTFHIPAGTYDGAPWSFTSDDGRFEMTFEPVIDRSAAMDLKILRSIQHQVFGHFTGFVVLDDGSKLAVERLLGFAEEVENRW